MQERGFLPLSAALLSSSLLDPEVGYAMDIYVDIVSSIEAIILSLLFCRSGCFFFWIFAFFIFDKNLLNLFNMRENLSVNIAASHNAIFPCRSSFPFTAP